MVKHACEKVSLNLLFAGNTGLLTKGVVLPYDKDVVHI
jgi:hypothetical protein